VNILAIESSTDLISVALLHGGQLIERAGERGVNHSDRVLPLVQTLLADAGLALAAMDVFAFGAGPGSFTGLRLACGVTQGLALGVAAPVIGICSLEALALDAGTALVYACVDARMNEVYCAAYRVAEGDVSILIAPTVAAPALAPVPAGDGWRGCGNGFAVYAAALAARLVNVTDIDATVVPRAGAVARLAALRYARGEAVDAALALPLYVRDKVALTTAERMARGGKA